MIKSHARITRGSRHGVTARLRILAFASDAQMGRVLADQLSALGVTWNLVVDDPSALGRMSSESEYDAVVVDAAVPPAKIDELLAHASAIMPGNAAIAVIRLVGNLTPVPNLSTDRGFNPLVQSVALQDLGAALNALSRAAALTTADVQRQVEIITRAAIRLGQRLNAINHHAPMLGELGELVQDIESSVEDEGPLLDVADTIAILRRLIQGRRLRERFFEGARFGEPAWDILLDLTLAWFEGKTVSVSSLCIASGVPMSTAMRWIHEMIEAGLIERWIDPTDGRRNLMQISSAARGAMVRYLAALYISKDAVSKGSPAAGTFRQRSNEGASQELSINRA